MNPIDVEVLRHAFQSIAEEMGIVLRLTSFSPNIKERLDFSCALTGPDGAMIAQAAHIPVHLGSCHLSARIVLDEVELEPGDVVLMNDPYKGGTHLPDLTVFAPIFAPGAARPSFGAIVRAHHADVGGGAPGSMGDFDEIYKEGIILPVVKVRARGRRVRDVEEIFFANVRTPDERRGDLAAQIAAAERGVRRLEEAMARQGVDRLVAASEALRVRAARAMAAVIAEIPDGAYRAQDRLDGPDSPRIAVRLQVDGSRLIVDFHGSSPSIAGSLNAHEAITLSCVFYCLRCLAPEGLPTNSGLLEPVELRLPPGSIVGACHPSAVAGGNVETSQRIVDVVFAAFAKAMPGRLPAASQGTMNNVSLGGRRADGSAYTYFETLAGGVGAGPHGAGASGLHTHMTNTLNTPIEAFELALPARITAYHSRRGSGGGGRHGGGEGIVREIEALAAMTATLLTTRRASSPPGAAGGGDAKPGRNILVRDGRARRLDARATVDLAPGDRLRVETPGGGGYGRARR